MKAAISCNYDPKYLFCLPIVTWAWNKLGVGVLITMPKTSGLFDKKLFDLIFSEMTKVSGESGIINQIAFFDSHDKNREVTYTQCSRLYAAAAFPNLSDTEIIVTSDVDMMVFKKPPITDQKDFFCILGHDIVPLKQFPICYISAEASTWRKYFTLDRPLQKCLDDLLYDINVENMRGNYWCKDQEEAYRVIDLFAPYAVVNRARGNTMFADNRVDRDDYYWEVRLNENVIDAHLWRPLYEPENLEKLIKLIKFMLPHENFDWIITYQRNFLNLL